MLESVSVSRFHSGTGTVTWASRAASSSRSRRSASILRTLPTMTTTAKVTRSSVTTPMNATVKRLLTLRVRAGAVADALVSGRVISAGPR
jgi:hypothetical protein